MLVQAAVAQRQARGLDRAASRPTLSSSRSRRRSRRTSKPDISLCRWPPRKSIAPVLKKGDLVVLESTSPVGTTGPDGALLAEAAPRPDIPAAGTANSPISGSPLPGAGAAGQGVARADQQRPRRSAACRRDCVERGASLYAMLRRRRPASDDCAHGRTGASSRRTPSATSTSPLPTSLSTVCEELDINVWEVIDLANRHPRVNILQPGPGVGGHCIAVDPCFIVDAAPDQRG